MRAAVLLLVLASVAQARPPTVRMPAPTVGPSYPAAFVERILRMHREELLRCLAFAGRRHASLHLAFTIERDGHASDATADGPAGISACIAWEIEQLEFPQPRGGSLIVSMPLAL